MIGTGFIGGKAVGMLLARRDPAKRNRNTNWSEHLEQHDSFLCRIECLLFLYRQQWLVGTYAAQKTTARLF